MKQNNISSLNGLRALATIGIFLFHSGLLPQGTFPVTLFFMLSGFLFGYSKRGRNDFTSYGDYLKRYFLKKVKQFYPLHLITLIAALFIGGVVFRPFDTDTVLSFVCNLFLVHPFWPPYAFSFNGLSWYLAIALFLYLIAYIILKATDQVKSRMALVVFSFVLLVLISTFNIIRLCGVSIRLYTSPFYRILDFALGYAISMWYSETKLSGKKLKTLEIILPIIFVIQYSISFVIGQKTGFSFNEIPGYYTPIFAAMIFVYAHNSGFVSKILSARVFATIAYYSFEFYMVHELALRFFRGVFESVDAPYILKCLIVMAPGGIVAIFIAVVYKNIVVLLKGKK